MPNISKPCLLGGPRLFTLKFRFCLLGGFGISTASEPYLFSGRGLSLALSHSAFSTFFGLCLPGGSALSTSFGPRLLGGFPGNFDLTPDHATSAEDSTSFYLKTRQAIKPPFPDVDSLNHDDRLLIKMEGK